MDKLLTLLCGFSYAESVGAVYHNTSAKLNRGIEETFLDLAKSKSRALCCAETPQC